MERTKLKMMTTVVKRGNSYTITLTKRDLKSYGLDEKLLYDGANVDAILNFKDPDALQQELEDEFQKFDNVITVRTPVEEQYYDPFIAPDGVVINEDDLPPDPIRKNIDTTTSKV